MAGGDGQRVAAVLAQLPVAAVVLVPIAVVVLAQLVASSSRRVAGRTPAAVVLRTE